MDAVGASLAILLYGTLATLFFGLLRVAYRLSRGEPSAKRPARIACVLMMLLPILTLPAILLLVKLNRHYDAYCREVAERQSD